IDTGTSKFDLSLHITEKANGFDGYLEYSTELFEAGTAARLIGHLRTLLEAACADPEQRLSQLPLLTDPERQQLTRWNATRAAYPRDPLRHGLVEPRARRTPAAEAVRCDGDALSYAELDRRASRLARRLRGLGVGPDVPVGICLERCLELPVALLATLKAG